MNVVPDKKVLKDIEKLPKYAKNVAAIELECLKLASNLDELVNVKQMKGTNEPYYRMKFNDYRFMLYYDVETNTVEVISLTHRKDTYKKQNLPWRR